MAKNRRRATILIFAFGITSLIEGIASEDVQVLVNDSVVISCFPNQELKVQWHHTSPGKSHSDYAYAGGRFYPPYNRGRFRVDNDPTANIYALVIANVTLEDAGLYECKDDVLSGVFDSTQLIILNSGPVCNSNMHPDGFIGPNECSIQKENMTFSCSISFFGKTPSLIWRSPNDSQSLFNSVCVTQSNRINCSLTLTADPEYDESVFICETKASNGGRFNCSTEVVKVQHFSAEYENSARKVGDNVSCIVRSNLETRYNWKLERNNQSFFLSSERMIIMKESGDYRCDVEYSIRNNTCSFLTSVVNVDSSDKVGRSSEKEQGNVPLIISTIVYSIVLLVVIAAFVVYTKRIRKRNKGKKTQTESEQSPRVFAVRATEMTKFNDNHDHDDGLTDTDVGGDDDDHHIYLPEGAENVIMLRICGKLEQYGAKTEKKALQSAPEEMDSLPRYEAYTEMDGPRTYTADEISPQPRAEVVPSKDSRQQMRRKRSRSNMQTSCVEIWPYVTFLIIGILATVIFATIMALHFKGLLWSSANSDPDYVTTDTLNKSTEIPFYAEVRKNSTGPHGLKREKRRPKANANGIIYNADKDDAVIYLDLKGGRSKVDKSQPVALPLANDDIADCDVQPIGIRFNRPHTAATFIEEKK